MPKTNQKNGFSQSSVSFQQKQGNSFPTQKTVRTAEEEQLILLSANPTDIPTSLDSGDIIPLLSYGGVAVAIIMAMAYFSQIQLKSITELLKAVNKKTQ